MNNEEKILELLEKVLTEQSVMRGEQMSMREKLDNIDERLLRVEMTQENKVLPQLKLLAEGHTQLADQIKRLSVIDAMQDDISTLKSAVRYLSQQMDQMKSAM